jgi:hypothetical protein
MDAAGFAMFVGRRAGRRPEALTLLRSALA